jgi:cytochrome bd-type quinol oxidase subunit 1
MVALGCLFVLLFIVMIYGIWKEKRSSFRIDNYKWILYGAIICVPLVYI